MWTLCWKGVRRRRVLVDREQHHRHERIPTDRVEVAQALRTVPDVVDALSGAEDRLDGVVDPGGDGRDPRRDELVEGEARAVIGDEQVPRLRRRARAKQGVRARLSGLDERRSHPGGALGAELCRHLFDLGWIATRGPWRGRRPHRRRSNRLTQVSAELKCFVGQGQA